MKYMTYRGCALIAISLLSVVSFRRCDAFAPPPLQSRTITVLSSKLRIYPRSRTNRLAPVYFRDREAEDEQFTSTVRNGNANKQKLQPATSAPSSSVATRQTGKSGGVSFQLIRSICFSQATMLFITSVAAAGMLLFVGNPVDLSMLHWNGVTSFTSFWDFSLTPIRLLQGVLATLPMVAFGSMVENSGRRDASHVNFSTSNMVVSLFGRRLGQPKQKGELQQPGATSTFTVLLLSFFIALFTGISEEIVFRGYLPTAIWSQSQSVLLAILGQATIFGLGHVHKNSTPIENRLVSGLQFVNGLWQGAVYLLTGGELLPCIISHALYDMHVFVETWKQINDQMDWTALAVMKTLPEVEEGEIRQLQKDIGSENLSDDTLAFCRRFFYAFDYEHRGSLSLRDVQRAISYAFLRDKIVPSEEQVRQAFEMVVQNRTVDPASQDTEQRLRLPDFLKLLLAFKAQAQSQAAAIVPMAATAA